MLYAAVKAENGISHSLSVEQKEEEELSKISTGIGKVFLQEVREREKKRQWKLAHLDPRNASRTPSAAREPAYRLRYESPVNACKLNNDLPRFHTCSWWGFKFSGRWYCHCEGTHVESFLARVWNVSCEHTNYNKALHRREFSLLLNCFRCSQCDMNLICSAITVLHFNTCPSSPSLLFVHIFFPCPIFSVFDMPVLLQSLLSGP